MSWRSPFWILFGFFAILVGIYPFLYFVVDLSQGFLSGKSPDVITNSVWQAFFNLHIIFGGLSLLIGWTQFIKRLRKKRIRLHRILGKIYVISVLLSGIGGAYLALFATGGLISSFGFGGLAVAWLTTTYLAYTSIRKKKVDAHQKWMTLSYALTFAAVTLRLWLPLLNDLFGIEFVIAYRIIAWLCWVPNLILAEWLFNRS